MSILYRYEVLMNEDTKSGALAKCRRRVLTLGERLRGWVDTATDDELRSQRRDVARRGLAVMRGLACFGIRVRPVNGVELKIDAAEKLLQLLENYRRTD